MAHYLFGIDKVSRRAQSTANVTCDGAPLLMPVFVCSGLGILGMSLAGSILGDLNPWYQPRTLIPVAGMLFGNTLSATSLGAASMTNEFAQSQSQLELRLARGASSKEAIAPIIRRSLSSALTPTINSMAVTGVVHMPGNSYFVNLALHLSHITPLTRHFLSNF